MERFLDLLFSGLALLLLSPLLIMIVLLLRFTGEGEVFFLQERVGRYGKPFKLFKFATMLRNSPNIGTGTVTLKDDPRVLPVGRFLRMTKINELPQLLNIFLGDMSMVGPRPQTLRCFGAFPPEQQDVIKRMKPGLSGVGSIVFRGEENMLHDHTFAAEFYDGVIGPYKGQVEAWYADNRSLYMYLAVIAVTLWVVIFPSSRLVWRVFKGVPAPPIALQAPLRYPGAGSAHT